MLFKTLRHLQLVQDWKWKFTVCQLNRLKTSLDGISQLETHWKRHTKILLFTLETLQVSNILSNVLMAYRLSRWLSNHYLVMSSRFQVLRNRNKKYCTGQWPAIPLTLRWTVWIDHLKWFIVLLQKQLLVGYQLHQEPAGWSHRGDSIEQHDGRKVNVFNIERHILVDDVYRRGLASEDSLTLISKRKIDPAL